jgi:hypothetical protein
MLEGYVVVGDGEFKYLNSSWFPHFGSVRNKCDSKIINIDVIALLFGVVVQMGNPNLENS